MPYKLAPVQNQELIKAAKKRRKLESLEGVLIHSDQGSVYRSFEYNKLAKKLMFTPSMSVRQIVGITPLLRAFFLN